MTDHQLAVIHDRTATPTSGGVSALDIARHMNSLMELGATLLRSGLLPESIKKPETAVAIIIKGLELGEQPMYALSNIVIVNGKPSISAEMMLARIYRTHGKRAIRVKASEDAHCTVEYRLDGWPDIQSYTFTIQDAQRAGLTGKQVWKQYPAAMLRARCISAVARMAFPECIAGMYVPGELGEPTTVTDDGEVLSIASVTNAAPAVNAHVTGGPVVELVEPGSDGNDDEPTEYEPGMDGEWNRSCRSLHVWARENNMVHSDLHYAAQALATRRNVGSLKDLSATDMRALRQHLTKKINEMGKVSFMEWLDSINPETPRAASPSDGRLPGVDDDTGEVVDTDAIAAHYRS